jgi:hypothetical protein
MQQRQAVKNEVQQQDQRRAASIDEYGVDKHVALRQLQLTMAKCATVERTMYQAGACSRCSAASVLTMTQAALVCKLLLAVVPAPCEKHALQIHQVHASCC